MRSPNSILRSAVLLTTLAVLAGSLAAWKRASARSADAAAARHPEPVEAVTAAVARERAFRPTTTSIGTVLALNSITLRNELPGTVREIALTPGQVVEAGTVLVALDVSVEAADLADETAQADLAATTLARLERLRQSQATSQEEVDQARAARDVAAAQIARTRAIIAQKTIRAPFRARVGLTDVHPGQYLNQGTELTTLQGVDAAANVDFTVAQEVAAALRAGQPITVLGRRADRSHDAQRRRARPHHARRARARRRRARGSARGTADHGRRDSGERPPQGARRRSCLRHRRRFGRQSPGPCPGRHQRHDGGRRNPHPERPQARTAGGHIRILQTARGRAGGRRRFHSLIRAYRCDP